ncbi:MAG: DUF1501 domain-containing protein [Nevskia sp.]|nr:DUF1501 domain-containing protein [Nevskia sp.]
MSNGINRRNVLLGLSGGLLAAQLPLLSRLAQAADYKALVCVFMFGGNDGNNTVIPLDATNYGAYSQVRGGLAIAQNQVVPLSPASGTAQFGLHPDLQPLQAIWNAGSLAVLFNTGTLVAPITKSQYLANSAPYPENLFSHADQQNQWQASISQGDIRSGWGGRIADTLAPAGTLPPVISFSGPDLYTLGTSNSPLSLPASGSFALSTDPGSYGTQIGTAFQSVAQQQSSNLTLQGAQAVLQSGLQNSTLINRIITGSSSIDSLFSGQTSSIAQQLQRVARLIAAQAQTGAARQIFFVSLGSFDTHSDQLNRQSQLFQQLAPALAAFYNATVQLGVASQVTTFTLSDFSRTFQPSANGGTDHAWGNHHFVLGGAVKGQTFYGQFPQLTLGGASDVSTEGRWLPTQSVDQYGATLASWFGVSAGNLATVFPNLGNFSTPNLGFMGS